MSTEQYRAVRERHPGMLLVFMDVSTDVLELLDDDAELASSVLGLLLDAVPPSGFSASLRFPRADMEGHLRNLLRKGHRVAICEPVH